MGPLGGGKKKFDLAGNAGAIMGGAKGLLELGTNIFGKSGIEEDETGNKMTTDLYGRPVYSTKSYQNSIDGIKDTAKGEVGKSVMGGAMSGFEAGMASGNAFIAGGGAIVGAIGGLIGGKRRKKEALAEVSNRENLLKESTIGFNADNKSYFEGEMADRTSSYLMSQRFRRANS